MSPQKTYKRALAQLFDNPHDAGARDAILVAGDVLEAAGDRTGARVALSEALAAETDRDRRRALGFELEELLQTERHSLLGSAADLMSPLPALTIEWRGGLGYGAVIDTRYEARRRGIEVPELVLTALASPALRTVRSLWIRVRTSAQATAALGTVLDHEPGLPLEELLVGRNPRPRMIAMHARASRVALPGLSPQTQTRAFTGFPRLWLVGYQDQARPLALWNGAEALPLRVQVEELEAMADDRPRSRAPLGRALWSREPTLRDAALRVIAHQGTAGTYISSLRLLLRPRVIADQAEVLAAIGRLGGDVLAIAPTLRRITGDRARYTEATRKAAGRALFAISPAA